MAMGLLESVPQFKLRAPGRPSEAPFRPPRHSKKVKFKSNVTNPQVVVKKIMEKVSD